MSEYVSIKEEVLQKLEANMPEIRERFGIQSLKLFGSVARGEDTVNSDIDLLYVFRDGYATYDNLFNLSEYLENLLGREIELVSEIWSTERFLASVLREAESIPCDSGVSL